MFLLNKMNRKLSLSYDIIYNIYYYIDDYSTANNFWILSKQFNENYMKKYNKPYIHKYKILYNNFFVYLEYLYLQKQHNITISLFLEYVLFKNLSNHNRLILLNDIFFIYNLYKNFLIKVLPSHKYNSLNKILCGGPSYLDKIFSLKFNKNHINVKISNIIPLIDLQ